MEGSDDEFFAKLQGLGFATKRRAYHRNLKLPQLIHLGGSALSGRRNAIYGSSIAPAKHP